MKIGLYAATTSTVLGLGIVAAFADLLPKRVSDYEYFIGTPCTIEGQPATCDVQFAGWTGGWRASGKRLEAVSWEWPRNVDSDRCGMDVAVSAGDALPNAP